MFIDKNPADEASLIEIICNMAKKLSPKQQLKLINYIKFIAKSDEKRTAERLTVKVTVDYAVGGKFYSDTLENISAGGAFIGTNRSFPKGELTSMVVFLPKMDRNIKVKGEIVRLTGEGFGVKLNEESKKILSDMYNHICDFQAF